MPACGSLPLKKSLSRAWTLGMRVEPPTRTISSISDFLKSASLSTFSTGLSVFLKRSAFISSNLARVSDSEKSLPSKRASISRRVEWACDSARLAFSASRLSLERARLSLEMSLPCFFLMRSTKCFMIRWSKSSPPRCVSPLVATTSKTPSSIDRIDTSKVPPPRSKMRTESGAAPLAMPPFFSSPYAIAAAVGSLMMRSTSRPARRPASLVAWRCWSLK
mmetsp:Transcript_26891/g.60291  ORF Transcript_26891/g.60291 Transcript_26891/m.60291 type:complete len:220 (+) Transcript_26891:925-1584(+)